MKNIIVLLMIRIVRLFSVMRNILLVRYEIMFWVSGK